MRARGTEVLGPAEAPYEHFRETTLGCHASLLARTHPHTDVDADSHSPVALALSPLGAEGARAGDAPPGIPEPPRLPSNAPKPRDSLQRPVCGRAP